MKAKRFTEEQIIGMLKEAEQAALDARRDRPQTDVNASLESREPLPKRDTYE